MSERWGNSVEAMINYEGLVERASAVHNNEDLKGTVDFSMIKYMRITYLNHVR